jgi:flagellar export protein FliJ
MKTSRWMAAIFANGRGDGSATAGPVRRLRHDLTKFIEEISQSAQQINSIRIAIKARQGSLVDRKRGQAEPGLNLRHDNWPSIIVIGETGKELRPIELLACVAEDWFAVPKQKYRLQPVLDVRDQAKKAAATLVANRRELLAAAQAELFRRQQAVADCRQRQADSQDRMLAEFKSGAEAHMLVTYRTHLADLRHTEQELLIKVEDQTRACESAEAEVEKAIAALIEASKEVQVIEKHRENWRQRGQRDERLREQKISDEISAVIHRRNRAQ